MQRTYSRWATAHAEFQSVFRRHRITAQRTQSLFSSLFHGANTLKRRRLLLQHFPDIDRLCTLHSSLRALYAEPRLAGDDLQQHDFDSLSEHVLELSHDSLRDSPNAGDDSGPPADSDTAVHPVASPPSHSEAHLPSAPSAPYTGAVVYAVDTDHRAEAPYDYSSSDDSEFEPL